MDHAVQIRQLESVLPLIKSARESLPSLVSSIARPAPTSPHLDLATLYRLASAHCEHSIAALGEALHAIEQTLAHAELSFATDPKDVVLGDSRDRNPWERVGDILQGSTTASRASSKPFEPTSEPPHTTEQLEHFLKTWAAHHPRVTLELLPRSGTEGDVERINLTLKGVMKATLVIRWERGAAVVQLAACSSLKENNPLYRPSRFTLFQDLTNSCMNLIDKSRSRSGETTSNLEEVLTFLSNPPLPF
ncbi:hypothetical protein JCM11491_004107 [Sporobolomyces phaffii]